MSSATLRGYRISALCQDGYSTVAIRDASYRLVAEYSYFGPAEDAIREVVWREGRSVLGQVPGYLSVADDLAEIERQWAAR